MGRDEPEVVLEGHRGEFRDAIEAEIDAAGKAANASAVPLFAGRRVGRAAGNFQYQFQAPASAHVQEDAPGDLLIPGRDPVEASVVAVEGPQVRVAVAEDLGGQVAHAKLRSSLAHLMRALIAVIEDTPEEANPAGERALGHAPHSGEPDLEVAVPAHLNAEQEAAVRAACGRDTTFIWGPPGTGKTQTIGAIGAALARQGRSVLVVSHTNTAVDQALLKIVEELGPDLQDGQVLRLGDPRDQRVIEREDLQAEHHVDVAVQAVATQRAGLTLEAEKLRLEVIDLDGRLDRVRRAEHLAEIAEQAQGDLDDALALRDTATRWAAVVDERAAHADTWDRWRPVAVAALDGDRAAAGRLGGRDPRWVISQADDARTYADVARRQAHVLPARADEAVDRVDQRLCEALEQAGEAPDRFHGTQARVNRLLELAEEALGDLGGRGEHELVEELEQRTVRLRDIETQLQTLTADPAAEQVRVVAGAQVLATTLTRAYLRKSVRARTFDTVVLDEASMAPIPALWAAAALAQRAVVVVGDFRQLPPIVLSEHPVAQKWLGRDPFEVAGVRDAYEAGEPPEHLVALREQFRMHPEISDITNELVYRGLLRDGAGTSSDRELDGWYDRGWGHDAPVLLVDTRPSEAWVTTVASGGRASRCNPVSAALSVQVAQRMLRSDRDALADGSRPRILIVSPYRPHANLVESLLLERGLEREVAAGTAHSFQGSEASVVILDLVNDHPHWRVGVFTPDLDEVTRRLFNVAVTRARRRLVVLGDLRYNRNGGKRAFLGRFVELLEGRHLASEAGAVARPGRFALDWEVLDAGTAPGQLARDVALADDLAVVCSPKLTVRGALAARPGVESARAAGARVVVVTRPASERGKREADEAANAERLLLTAGAEVVRKKAMLEKLVLVDDRLMWVCGLHPLACDLRDGWAERSESGKVADLVEELSALRELAAGAADRCPVCAEPMMACEARNAPFYWRCSGDGCWTRDIGQQLPVDGRIVCNNCGGPVEFGWRGEQHRPVWKCTSNVRHWQRFQRRHLLLDRMRAQVPPADLAEIETGEDDVTGVPDRDDGRPDAAPGGGHHLADDTGSAPRAAGGEPPGGEAPAQRGPRDW